MSQQTFCSWCGKDNAEKQCQCKRVNYCNELCMREGRAEHRLSCPSSKPTTNHFAKPGAIVRISGLQSEAGQKLNQQLAEVLEVQKKTGRIGVILTMDRKVITRSIKPENLTVELSVLDAAKLSIETERMGRERERTQAENAGSSGDDASWEAMEGCTALERMSASEIVRKIRENDFRMTVNMENAAECIDMKLEEEKKKNGGEPMGGADQPYVGAIAKLFEEDVIGTCLDKLAFPESIDDAASEPTTGKVVARAFCMLCNMFSVLVTSDYSKETLNGLFATFVQQSGPAIFTLCCKKRRVYNRTDIWQDAAGFFFRLLRNCISTGCRPGRRALLALDPVVLKSFKEYNVTCLTVDCALFLDVETVQMLDGMRHQNIEIKLDALSNLDTLVDKDFFGDDFVEDIGRMRVPRGSAGLGGRRFAQCFLNCAAALAITILKERPAFQSGLILRCLKRIYVEFTQCEKLRPFFCRIDLMGVAFLYLESTSEFEKWAENRLRDMDNEFVV